MRPAAIQNSSIVGDIVNKIAARAGPIMYAIRDMLLVHPHAGTPPISREDFRDINDYPCVGEPYKKC